MSFTLPELPYGYDALEPFVDTQTMKLHHSKHHQTYVSNVNAALSKFPEFEGLGIEEVNKRAGTSQLPNEIATTVRNNGGGHWNHSFFWRIMCNPSSSGGPAGELKHAIESSFGSVSKFMDKFNAAAAGRFGSGWAWLVVTPEGLQVTSTPNQDNPLMTGLVEVPGSPVLGLDYYLKYQNKRAEYIAAWWNVVNWEQANTNLKAAHDANL